MPNQQRNNRPLFGKTTDAPRHYFCSIDPRGYTVIRGNKAERLGLIAFTVFSLLHRVPGKKLSAAALVDHVYDGTINPATRNSIHSSIYYANRRLKRLGLKIKGVNRRQNSFYQIVEVR